MCVPDSDLPEGDPARHRHLQREGNSQEHVGAEARVQALPERGEERLSRFVLSCAGR